MDRAPTETNNKNSFLTSSRIIKIAARGIHSYHKKGAGRIDALSSKLTITMRVVASIIVSLMFFSSVFKNAVLEYFPLTLNAVVAEKTFA